MRDHQRGHVEDRDPVGRRQRSGVLREPEPDAVIVVDDEVGRSNDVEKTLDSAGRAAARSELAAVLARAQARDLLDGEPAEMAERFLALLWGDLMMGLLLRLVDPPAPEEAGRRARDAASALLRLYPEVGSPGED